MRIKRIRIPIYYGDLVIVVAEDFTEAARKFKIKDRVDLYGAFVWYSLTRKLTPEYLVCVDPKIENHLIAHECVHLVNYIFKHTGVHLDRDNDEAQAYLTGWCFKQIDNFLIKIYNENT